MALTGREKATIFLSILGADVSSRVLRYLPAELADLIAAGVNHLPTPSPEALSEVMGEYRGFLALPAAPPPPPPRPVVPQKSLSSLVYERPQVTAFVLSLLSPGERTSAMQSLPRDRALIEELMQNLRPNILRPKLEARLKAHFAGKIF
jgi:flagellar motor switch protein FliG